MLLKDAILPLDTLAPPLSLACARAYHFLCVCLCLCPFRVEFSL
jgi:hypothetical protein